MTFTTDTIVDAPTDAIVDAETGCLLRLISYAGDTLAIWSELDDISTEPAGPELPGRPARPSLDRSTPR